MPTILKTLGRSSLAVVLIVLLGATPALLAETHHAQTAASGNPLATNTSNFKLNFGFGKDIALAAVGVGAVVGVGLYLVLRKGPSVTGCVEENASGLALKNESDQRGYVLTGKTASLKPGERVHVYGKKEGKTEPRQFVVKKPGKDLGACSAVAHPA